MFYRTFKLTARVSKLFAELSSTLERSTEITVLLNQKF